MSQVLSSKYRYGYIPDLPDQRDLHFSPTMEQLLTLPPVVDLRSGCPPVYDQGDLGSCTANAIAGALQFEALKQQEAALPPSRLFIYYNERVIEHSINSDAGAMIRDGIKSVNKAGACLESSWPYVISKFAVQPPSTCYAEGLKHTSVKYKRVPRSLAGMKAILAAGFPFVYGFTVYESFESDQVAANGMVPMPAHGEEVLGGHAVLCVGYHDTEQVWICRNSWSDQWGDKGYFYMPYAYLLSSSLSSDFWTIESVE